MGLIVYVVVAMQPFVQRLYVVKQSMHPIYPELHPDHIDNEISEVQAQSYVVHPGIGLGPPGHDYSVGDSGEQ